jgi:hypothetical protein
MEWRKKGPALRAVLEKFVEDVEATGGVAVRHVAITYPLAAEDWTDLASTYLQACAVLGREPKYADR